MWRYNVGDLTDDDIRRLRLLVKIKRAEAHIVVKSDRPWISPIKPQHRQWNDLAEGAAIH